MLDAIDPLRPRDHAFEHGRREHVDHRRPLRRADRDLRVLQRSQIGGSAHVEARELRTERDRPLDQRVRVVGDDDHGVIGEKRVGAARRAEQPRELAVGLGDRGDL